MYEIILIMKRNLNYLSKEHVSIKHDIDVYVKHTKIEWYGHFNCKTIH